MPAGSSSDSPAMRPGPSTASRVRNRNRCTLRAAGAGPASDLVTGSAMASGADSWCLPGPASGPAGLDQRVDDVVGQDAPERAALKVHDEQRRPAVGGQLLDDLLQVGPGHRAARGRPGGCLLYTSD